MAKRIYTRVKDTHDPRDHYYRGHLGVAQPLKEILPMAVDLRPFCSPVEDQGETSSCTGHAICAALEYDEKQLIADPSQFQPFSRLFVYYNERLVEHDTQEDGGGQIRDGIKCLATYGACHETYWPFNPKELLVKPSMEAYQEAVKHKALSYQRVPQTKDALFHCLAITKKPVVFGITVYESFESATVEKTGIVPMPSTNEQQVGGHAVTIVGYDTTKNVFIVRNSWGPKWGIHGYFELPFDYVLRPDLADDFWVVSKIAAA